MSAAEPKSDKSNPKGGSKPRQRRRAARRGDTPFDRFLREARAAGSLARLTGLCGAANRVAASHLIRAHGNHPVLYVTAHSRASDSATLALRGLLGEREELSRLRVFPRHDTLPFDRFSPQPFLVSQRMEILHRLEQWVRPGDQREEALIIVTSRSALSLRLPSRTRLRASTHHISVGESLDRDVLVARLIGVGYQRMALVEEPGEVAVRGDIIDVFPPQLAKPLRIELWGDEIDSIRNFDPASQRSQTKSATALLPPPRELLFDREGVIERSEAIRAAATQQSIPTREIDELIDALLRGHVPPGAEALAPLIQPGQETFFDYLPEDTLVLVEEPEEGATRLQQVFDEVVSNRESALGERLTVGLESLLLAPEEIDRALADRAAIRLERLDLVEGADEKGRHRVETESHAELRRQLVTTRSHERALTPLIDRCREWLRERWRVVIAVGSLSSAERIRTLLGEYELEGQVANEPRPVWYWSLPGRVEIRVAPLAEGFVWREQGLVVVSEEEIFGIRERKRSHHGWRDGQKFEGIRFPGNLVAHSVSHHLAVRCRE